MNIELYIIMIQRTVTTSRTQNMNVDEPLPKESFERGSGQLNPLSTTTVEDETHHS